MVKTPFNLYNVMSKNKLKLVQQFIQHDSFSNKKIMKQETVNYGDKRDI